MLPGSARRLTSPPANPRRNNDFDKFPPSSTLYTTQSSQVFAKGVAALGEWKLSDTPSDETSLWLIMISRAKHWKTSFYDAGPTLCYRRVPCLLARTAAGIRQNQWTSPSQTCDKTRFPSVWQENHINGPKTTSLFFDITLHFLSFEAK